MPEFPKTLSFVTGQKQRKHFWRGPSVTEILTLDENGNRVEKYHPGAQCGVYVWKDKNWELHGDPHPTAHEADAAAARYRRNLRAAELG